MNELKQIKLKNTLQKVNRELSWLSFNERVLYEALDSNVPVLERLRFLGIYSNNLDEFFRVRVATLHRLIGSKSNVVLGYSPQKILHEIYQKLIEDEVIFQSAFDDIQKELKKKGIVFLDDVRLSAENLFWAKNHFVKHIRGAISPLLFRDDLRFPILKDKSIYLAVKLIQRDRKVVYSLIEVPTDFFSRFIEVPSHTKNVHQVILLEDLIRINLKEIYKVFDIQEIKAYTIKMTRDAELDLDNDFSKTDVAYFSKKLSQRKRGAPVRFIADKDIPQDLLQFLLTKNRISRQNVLLSDRFHNFKDFMRFPNFGIPNLNYPSIDPIIQKRLESSKTILSAIESRDVVLMYPYQSFDYLLDFLRESSINPDVTEIKMSLYRLSRKSQIVNILMNAVKNGKKVLVVLEITARFDEENNIFWANQMREEGIQVIYGHPDYKVHAKMVYVKKRSQGKITEYANISTGNFNEVTADIYSDIALFTSRKILTREISQVFDFLEYSKIPKPKYLLVAPFNMRERLLEKIEREIRNKKRGAKAHIIWKANSLVDDQIIDKLYEASTYGVQVDIIVRGICCLPTQKSNPHFFAMSIIDKFLEHSRVYYFFNKGDEECYISSADIMVRNLDYRVELACPIMDSLEIKKIKKFLSIQLQDTVKGRIQNANMSNPRNTLHKSKNIRSQDEIYRWIATGARV